VVKNAKTSRVWYHHIMFIEFWEHPDAAAEFFKRWFMHAVRSKLASVVAVARSLKRHLPGRFNDFAHPITNAPSEGLNS